MKKAIRSISVSTSLALSVLGLFPATTFALSPGATMAATSLNMTVLLHKLASSWPWYISRASGIVAAVLLLLLALSGIGQVTGFTYRFMEPLMSWSVHRAIAIAFGVCVCFHGISLLFDKFVPYNIFQIIIPFTSPDGGIKNGSLYTAYGILAAYLGAILIFTSLYWMNKKQKTWRLLHYLSYILVALVFLHGLYLGTDIHHGFLRVLWWIAGIILITGILSRLLRVGTIHQAKHKA